MRYSRRNTQFFINFYIYYAFNYCIKHILNTYYFIITIYSIYTYIIIGKIYILIMLVSKLLNKSILSN